ncbi:MAG: hypothetical protein RL033_5602, partial [Pseudomonadota bacterium]
MQHLTCSEASEVLLDDSNLIEESQRVERCEHGAQSLLHRLVNSRPSKQTSA